MSLARLLAALLLAAPLLVSPVRADDGDGETPPPAEKPAGPDLIEQWDRKKIMSMKLPKTWKPPPAENIDPKSLLSYVGFLGEEGKSPQAQANFYLCNQFGRAALARAIDLPEVGPVKADAARQEAGWAEGCAVDNRQHLVQFRRYVERSGRVYMFVVYALEREFDVVRAQVQRILDTAKVTGDYAPPALQGGLSMKKLGEFDVVSDAEADRAKDVDKQRELLAQGRDVAANALKSAGKPFDVSRPTAWIFQNATKYEDKVKSSIGVEAKVATFAGPDRASMVEMMSKDQSDHNEVVYRAGAQQYVWQFFGGETPPWVTFGLGSYSALTCVGGGKGRLPGPELAKVKEAVAAAKRRLIEWVDARPVEITDGDVASRELFAWHTYLRSARVSKKNKAAYDAYLKTLRDTGDPAAARKTLDGLNFDEMLADFKAWASEWK